MKLLLKKYRIAILCTFIVCSLGIVLLVQANEEVVLKQDVFTMEVNKEIELDIELYLEGVKQPKKAVFHFDDVNIEQLGEYPASIEYKGVTYAFTFNIKDTTKPTLDITMNSFTFSLASSLEEVNKEIQDAIEIKDNYDREFEKIQVINEIPNVPQKVESTFSVKDSSGNESEQATVYVEFIADDTSEELGYEDTPTYQPSNNSSSTSTSNGVAPSIPNKKEETPAIDPTPPIATPPANNTPPSTTPPSNPPANTAPTTPPDSLPTVDQGSVVHKEVLGSWDEALQRADDLTGWLDSPYYAYKYMIIPAQSGSVTLLIIKD